MIKLGFFYKFLINKYADTTFLDTVKTQVITLEKKLDPTLKIYEEKCKQLENKNKVLENKIRNNVRIFGVFEKENENKSNL